MNNPQLDPYLFFNGNCAEAIRFYEKALDGKLAGMMRYGESPEPSHCPAGSADRIMHAAIDLNGQLLMASDVPSGESYEGMKNVSLSLFYRTVDEARRAFTALGEGGKVTMPLAETFWADIFGMLTDRFGTSWMISGGMKQKPQG